MLTALANRYTYTIVYSLECRAVRIFGAAEDIVETDESVTFFLSKSNSTDECAVNSFPKCFGLDAYWGRILYYISNILAGATVYVFCL